MKMIKTRRLAPSRLVVGLDFTVQQMGQQIVMELLLCAQSSSETSKW